MILTDNAILAALGAGTIEIAPFVSANLGTNSYDVTLGESIGVYDKTRFHGGTWEKKDEFGVLSLDNSEGAIGFIPQEMKALGFELVGGVIDVRKPAPPLILTKIPAEGLILYPNRLYLGVTVERTYTPYHLPILHGKSSPARLGIECHVCAGFGDTGFNGTWTLEIRVMYPTRIYAGMKIGQICFHEITGEIGTPYDKKPTAKYTAQSDLPVASLFFGNFDKDTQPTGGEAV